MLRVKLFSGDAPRIRGYSGFGFLKVRAAMILNQFSRRCRTCEAARADRRPRRGDPARPRAPGSDPRDAAARAQLVAVVKAALEAAIAALPGRDRTFLRHVMIDGLTLEQIATTYQVHRARQRLHDATRALGFRLT